MKIRAYNAIREVDSQSGNAHSNSFTLGTRALLTCDGIGLPEGSEVISYKWYCKCTRPMCEIQEGTPYYRAVDDTLLVDVTSQDLGGTYYCDVMREVLLRSRVATTIFKTGEVSYQESLIL